MLLRWLQARSRFYCSEKRRKINKFKDANKVGRSDFENFILSTNTNANLQSYWCSLLNVGNVSVKVNKLFTTYDTEKSCRVKINNGQDLMRISFFLSIKMILALIIEIQLLRQNIESHPGPRTNHPDNSDKCNFSVVTFNANGLGDVAKLRRVLTKADNCIKKGGFFLVQESHLIKDDIIKLYWRHNFEMSNFRTNSAGVLTLYSNDFKTLHSSSDDKGRRTVTLVENNLIKVMVVNIYVPNNHSEAIIFMEETYLKILEVLNDYPDSFVIIGGDINVCMTDNDCINRQRGKIESELAESIRNNNILCNLQDAFRAKHASEGYTWNRGSCYSRLDHVFVSDNITRYITKAESNWNFEKSDHAAVKITFNLPNDPKQGKGIVKINMKIIENKAEYKNIENEISEQLKQIPEGWDPHQKLEFLKMTVRSVFSYRTGKIRKELNDEIAEVEESLNNIEMLKIKFLKNSSESTREERLSTINNARITKSNELAELRKRYDKQLQFRSKVKWFEYGERSNSFFLNLNKWWTKKKAILEIVCNGIRYTGNTDVIVGIREFYRDLYESKSSQNQGDDDDEGKEDDFYKECKKLDPESKDKLEESISKDELRRALNSCKESAPGPDGIPYMFYKKYWHLVGEIITESWEHSVRTGKMPISHLESVITVLPKDGKDLTDIKNWRPITLTNCDAKIITKALAARMAKITDKIIDKTQTAYIPGRSVMDNIRSNLFLKNHCKTNNLDAVLISLDAKKAFDSVDHNYIRKTLAAYGFGPTFIKYFNTLYNGITARILVNGFFSDIIKIERGVKQGDALSCAIFILCIDPLIRNMNANRNIKGITIKTRKSNKVVCHKASGYADDISIVCHGDNKSVQAVFDEYQRLTTRSGLVLNADKTEILRLNGGRNRKYNIRYEEKLVELLTVDKIKICGICFCTDQNVEYSSNVLDKINKFESKLKGWLARNLTLEGKVLIVKTFGLSQLIYIMQCVQIREQDIIDIERKMFNFLWSNKNTSGRPIDRIKRSLLKNDIAEGGLKVTDIECLDRALKLRQFIRADESNHNISIIQLSCMEKLGYDSVLINEFAHITNEESICSSAQTTINSMMDHNRLNKYEGTGIAESSTETVNQIYSINVNDYLKRSNKILLQCVYTPLKREGLTVYGELVRERESEMDKGRIKRLEMVINGFPKYFREIANSFDEDINYPSRNLSKILTLDKTWIPITQLKTKEIQVILKKCLNKTTENSFDERLGISFEMESLVRFREQCKNAKLRNIYYRMVNGDFFTYVRMKKFKMSDNDNCPRCGETETTRHLLWECRESANMWRIFNNAIRSVSDNKYSIRNYSELYNMNGNAVINTIKVKIIQEIIQITRPVRWSVENLRHTIMELKNIELYIAIKNNKLNNHNIKWKCMESLLRDEL